MKFQSELVLPVVLAFVSQRASAAPLDFEGPAAGAFVSSFGVDTTVKVVPLPSSSGGCFEGDVAGTFGYPMIFDTGSPTGGDTDLGTPHGDFGGPGVGRGGREGEPGENAEALGNVLIISQDCDQSEPNDSRDGGSFVFTFAGPKPIKSIGLLDMEAGSSVVATCSDGSIVDSGELPDVGNNGFAEYMLHLEDVVELKVTTQRSGAVAFIKFMPCDPVGAYGDPHFKTWNKTIYSYHGMCDLILLDNPAYPSGLGSKIHIRTKIVADAYSIIKTAVVAIGSDTFEVEMDSPTTYYNGSPALLPLALGGGVVVTLIRTKSVPGGTLYVYEINLGDKDRIIVKSFPQWVDVRIKSLENRKTKFGQSLGMLGSLDGTWYAPDSVTVLDDAVSLANEWQVKTGSTLFTSLGDGPQYPDACELPSTYGAAPAM